MLLKINGIEITKYPSEFQVSVKDLDARATTTRTADGTLSRDRIAVKRQVDMKWNALKWEDLSAVLGTMTDEFFEFTYPDPLTGTQETKTFYVGDRDAGVAIERNGVYWWQNLQLTLTEQ